MSMAACCEISGDLVRVSDSLTWDRRETYLERPSSSRAGMTYATVQNKATVDKQFVACHVTSSVRSEIDRGSAISSGAAMCPSGIRRW